MPRSVEKWLVPLLVVLHAFIALPLAFSLNVWVDEASTLYTTANGLIAAFGSLFTDEKQAPLYFLLLSLWRSIDHSIFFARLFSVACSLLAIIAFSRLAGRIWDRRNALTLTALFAFHPFLFWASLEIRLYSFVILITCLLFNFFVDGFFSQESESDELSRRRKRDRILFALTASAALYTNYYLGFPIVGCLGALLITKKWKAAKTYVLLMAAVGVSILPLFYIVSLQFADRVASFQETKSVAEALRIIWNHFLTFALPTEIYTPEDQTTISLVRLWIVRISIVGALIIFIKSKFRYLDKNIAAFVAISAISAVFLIFVYFQLGSAYVEIRHAAVYFVSIFVLVGAIVVKLIPDRLRFFALLIVLSFYGYSLISLYPLNIKRGDWENVAAYISYHETPAQPIVIFPVYETVALPQYYKGVNEILPDERKFAFFAEDSAGSVGRYERQIQFLISEIPAEASEIWLLTGEACSIGEACAPLEKFVEANYTVVQEQDLYREKVRLLRKKQ